MNVERKKWRVFLSTAVIIGSTTVGCARPSYGKEENDDQSLSTPITLVEPTKTITIFVSPIVIQTEMQTPTETPTLIPTETPTPASTTSQTPTETKTPLPTNTKTASPTLKPSPSTTINSIENKTNVRYPITSGNPSRPEIALTIDDGYDKTSVEKMLKILKEKKIKCTFFIPGQYLLAYPDLWKKAIEDGHQICNHSSTHSIDWKNWISEEKVKQEITEWEIASNKVLGEEYTKKMRKEFPFIRFPYGGGNKSENILKIAQDLGYMPVWYSINPETNGGIFLLHFIPKDANNLEEIITRIEKKGLKAVTVSELLR